MNGEADTKIALSIMFGGGGNVTIGVNVYPSPADVMPTLVIEPPAPIVASNSAVTVVLGSLKVICGWNV